MVQNKFLVAVPIPQGACLTIADKMEYKQIGRNDVMYVPLPTFISKNKTPKILLINVTLVCFYDERRFNDIDDKVNGFSTPTAKSKRFSELQSIKRNLINHQCFLCLH